MIQIKKFLYIFRGGNPPEEKRNENYKDWETWIDKLKLESIYDVGDALVPGGKIVTGKKFTVSDVAINNNALTGYLVVKFETLDQAIDGTKDSPGLDFDGSIEVREIMEM